MSIKLRFALLLCLLLAGLLLVLVWHQRLLTGATAGLLAASRQTREQLLDHWIDFSSRALPQFTADTAQAGVRRLLAQPDPELRRKLADLLRRRPRRPLGVQDDGASRTRPPDRAAAPPPRSRPGLVASSARRPRCFAPAGPGCSMYASAGYTVRAGRRRLAAARRWDEGHLRGLAALADARVALRPPHGHRPKNRRRRSCRNGRSATTGHPLRTLLVEPESRKSPSLRDGRQRGFPGFGLG